MTRTERLRLAKGWAQPQLAEHLRVTQATVSRLENGQAESGPISLLLDQLEAELSAAPVVAPGTNAEATERAA